MKKMLLALLFMSIGAMSLFGEVNPLETMSTAFRAQAKDQVLPIIVFYILIFGAVIAFMMKQWMPLIMAVIISVILAMSPSLSSSFIGFGDGYVNPTTTTTTP